METILKYLLRSIGSCYDAQTIKCCLSFLVSQGFRLITDTEKLTYDGAVPEVSHALQLEIVDKYLAHRTDQLSCTVYSLENEDDEVDLDFYLHLDPVAIELTCYINWETRGRLPDPPSYQALMTVFKEFCHIWRPFYAYEEFEGGCIVSWDRIIYEQDVTYLYDTNFFGPELVQKLGRERLLSAPAWKVEEFDDGGIFLVPEEQLRETEDGEIHSLKKVAEYLGLETPQAPGEEWDDSWYEYHMEKNMKKE